MHALEIDEVHPVVEVVVHVACRLQCQARLAGAARAEQRQQPCPDETVLDLAELAAASDEAVERDRNVARRAGLRRLQRAQRAVLGPEVRVHHLEHTLGLTEVT